MHSLGPFRELHRALFCPVARVTRSWTSDWLGCGRHQPATDSNPQSAGVRPTAASPGFGGRASRKWGSLGQVRHGRWRLRLTNGSRTGKNGARPERVGGRQVRLTDAAERWRSDLQARPARCGLVSTVPAIEGSAGRRSQSRAAFGMACAFWCWNAPKRRLASLCGRATPRLPAALTRAVRDRCHGKRKTVLGRAQPLVPPRAKLGRPRIRDSNRLPM